MRSGFFFLLFLLSTLTFISVASLFVWNTLSVFLAGRFHNLLSTLRYAFFLFPFLLVLTMSIGNNIGYSKINSFIYSISVYWIPVLIFLLMGAVLLWILFFFGKFTQISIPFVPIILTLFGVIIILLCVGIYQATHPKVTTYTITHKELAERWGDKKIVLFSDSHLGMVRNKTFTEKIVSLVQAQNPDMLIIAGDLIDGPIFPYDTSLRALGMLRPPLGIYYSAGNHDEYNKQQEDYYASLTKYVTVLNDKKTTVQNTQLIGLSYANETLEETRARLDAVGYNKEEPSIIIFHDPKNTQALASKDVSLVLSGHTHGGQFFPFTLLIKSIYGELSQGVHTLGKTTSLTTIGIGTAGPLFRLGMQPEIVVFTFTSN